MAGSTQKTDSSHQEGPWGPATEAVKGMIPQVQAMQPTLAGWTPYGNYTGPTVAGFTPTQQAGISMTTDLATGGGSTVGDANALNRYTLGGGFLSAGNPYFQGMADRVTQQVLPNLDAQWSQAGRFSGNEEAPRAIGRGLMDAIAPLAYQNYMNERGNMINAQGMAPTLDQAQYTDPQALLGVGSMQQQLNWQQIADQIYRAQYAQAQPEQALQMTLGQLEGLGKMGSQGTSTTTQTTTPSPLQTGLGGALMVGGLMTGNPLMMGMGGSAFGMKSPFGGGGGTGYG